MNRSSLLLMYIHIRRRQQGSSGTSPSSSSRSSSAQHNTETFKSVTLCLHNHISSTGVWKTFLGAVVSNVGSGGAGGGGRGHGGESKAYFQLYFLCSMIIAVS